MNPAERIIETIICGRLLRVEGDRDEGYRFIWAANAVEQIDALLQEVKNSIGVDPARLAERQPVMVAQAMSLLPRPGGWSILLQDEARALVDIQMSRDSMQELGKLVDRWRVEEVKRG